MFASIKQHWFQSGEFPTISAIYFTRISNVKVRVEN